MQATVSFYFFSLFRILDEKSTAASEFFNNFFQTSATKLQKSCKKISIMKNGAFIITYLAPIKKFKKIKF